jgi:hypothetical protein
MELVPVRGFVACRSFDAHFVLRITQEARRGIHGIELIRGATSIYYLCGLLHGRLADGDLLAGAAMTI